jgi:hypothetical protein
MPFSGRLAGNLTPPDDEDFVKNLGNQGSQAAL